MFYRSRHESSEAVELINKGERSKPLPGGQQQRLALARGLLACQDKEILLLDEPTSSLDAITELKVYRNILEGFSDKTIISTVHQLHLLALFDRICVFDKGRLVEVGTLAELHASSTVFNKLWAAMEEASRTKTAEASV